MRSLNSADPDRLFEAGAITLPIGDWYVEPPVEGEYEIHAQSDGARGQYISMAYQNGYQAFIHMDSAGVLRVQLLRFNAAWPADVDYAGQRIRFRQIGNR